MEEGDKHLIQFVGLIEGERVIGQRPISSGIRLLRRSKFYQGSCSF